MYSVAGHDASQDNGDVSKKLLAIYFKIVPTRFTQKTAILQHIVNSQHNSVQSEKNNSSESLIFYWK